jgi:hypothetical protein
VTTPFSTEFRRVALGLIAVLLGLTCFVSIQRYSFVKHGILTEAEVLEAERPPGPPKRPGVKRVTIRYKSPEGVEYIQETRTPFLLSLDKGQFTKVIVDPNDPSKFFFRSWPDVWGLPSLMSVIAALVGFFTFAFSKVKRTQQ